MSCIKADNHLRSGHAQALRATVGAGEAGFGLTGVLRQRQGTGEGGGDPTEEGLVQQWQTDALGKNLSQVGLATGEIVLRPADDALIHVLFLLNVEVVIVQNAHELLLGHLEELLLPGHTQELPQKQEEDCYKTRLEDEIKNQGQEDCS